MITKNTGSFKGFPSETFSFLDGLSKNNNKKWFASHREAYENTVVGPALLFVETMGDALATLAPGVTGEPRIGGSLFRIHKDTRFSKDKRPYKTHIGVRFRDPTGARSPGCQGPVFYVEIDASHLRLGVGTKAFGREELETFREHVVDRCLTSKLDRIVTRALKNGHAVLGETLKRVPQAYMDLTESDLVRRKGLFVMQEEPVPSAISGRTFVSYCLTRFKPYVPLYQALTTIMPD